MQLLVVMQPMAFAIHRRNSHWALPQAPPPLVRAPVHAHEKLARPPEAEQ